MNQLEINNQAHDIIKKYKTLSCCIAYIDGYEDGIKSCDQEDPYVIKEITSLREKINQLIK